MKKLPLTLMLISTLLMGGCCDPYVVTQQDSCSSEMFSIPGQTGCYIVKTKDGNIWYYSVKESTGIITKYVVFGNVIASNCQSRTFAETNKVELEKCN